MRKFLSSLALVAAIGALVASVSPSAPAQQKDKKDSKDTKKEDKKDPKKDEKKDEKSDESKVEVYQGKDGWRFRVVGPDGKSVAIGVQPYAKKEECLAAVEVVKATLGKAKLKEPQKD